MRLSHRRRHGAQRRWPATPAIEADAVVVLGCSITRGGVPSAALQRRITLAARAFEQCGARWLIASGGRRWHGHVEARVMARELVAAGISSEAIVMELCSHNTRENGWYSAAVLRALGARRVLIATCAWHLPRALGNFRRLGVNVVAPPPQWLDTPPASTARRLREGLCRWTDSAMMARYRP